MLKTAILIGLMLTVNVHYPMDNNVNMSLQSYAMIDTFFYRCQELKGMNDTLLLVEQGKIKKPGKYPANLIPLQN